MFGDSIRLRSVELEEKKWRFLLCMRYNEIQEKDGGDQVLTTPRNKSGTFRRTSTLSVRILRMPHLKTSETLFLPSQLFVFLLATTEAPYDTLFRPTRRAQLPSATPSAFSFSSQIGRRTPRRPLVFSTLTLPQLQNGSIFRGPQQPANRTKSASHGSDCFTMGTRLSRVSFFPTVRNPPGRSWDGMDLMGLQRKSNFSKP